MFIYHMNAIYNCYINASRGDTVWALVANLKDGDFPCPQSRLSRDYGGVLQFRHGMCYICI